MRPESAGPARTRRTPHGLVYGMEIRVTTEEQQPWFRRPLPMGSGVIVLSVLLYVGLELL